MSGWWGSPRRSPDTCSSSPYPKSRAGRRTVPLPRIVVHALTEHRRRFGNSTEDLILTASTGQPIKRGTFRLGCGSGVAGFEPTTSSSRSTPATPAGWSFHGVELVVSSADVPVGVPASGFVVTHLSLTQGGRRRGVVHGGKHASSLASQ